MGEPGPEEGTDGQNEEGRGGGARMGGWGPDGGMISKHPLGIVWHETTLTSHQSGILHSLSFGDS